MGPTSENQGVMALHAKKRSGVSSGFFAALLLVVLILVVAMFERGRLLVLAETASVNGPWILLLMVSARPNRRLLRVLRLAVAERPVLFLDLDQIDENVLTAQV